jgi:hypothetical protein
MRKLSLIGFVALAVGAQASPVVFYGGDYNGVEALASQVNGFPGGFADARTYDNFSLSSTTTIDSVFGNFVEFGTIHAPKLSWEIRSGVSVGNGGTLLFSGDDFATATANGSAFTYSANITPVTLAAGNYFLSIAADGGDANIYVGKTTGTNGVGGPLNDDNSFLSVPSFGLNFGKASDQFNGNSSDFSFGLTGSTVPEPASLAVLGLGAIALLRRRRK